MNQPTRLSMRRTVSTIACAAFCAVLLATPDPAQAQSAARRDRAARDAAAASSAVQLAGVLRETMAERHLRDNPVRFEATVVGGTVHEAAKSCFDGALEALIGGGSGKDARRKCAERAPAGAASGARRGRELAQAEEDAGRELRDAKARAERARQDNERLQAYVDASGEVLRESRTRLAQLQAEARRRRGDASAAEAALQRERDNLRAMQDSLAQARRIRDAHAGALSNAPRADARALDDQIARMDRHIEQLERNVRDYERALRVSGA
jgi:hypothetical protein